MGAHHENRLDPVAATWPEVKDQPTTYYLGFDERLFDCQCTGTVTCCLPLKLTDVQSS